MKDTKIDGDYSKDESNIYFHGKILKGATPKSFKILSNKHIDFENRYYGPFRIILSNGSVYLNSEKILGINTKKIKIINSFFISDGKNIYFNEKSKTELKGNSHFFIKTDIDIKTFEQLNSKIYKDCKNIYYIHRYESSSKVFANTSSYNLEKIDTLNPKTSKILEVKNSSIYISDNRNVVILYEYNYYDEYLNQGTQENRIGVFEKIDIKTFEIVDDIYSKDKNHVYEYGKIMEGVDPKDF